MAEVSYLRRVIAEDIVVDEPGLGGGFAVLDRKMRLPATRQEDCP